MGDFNLSSRVKEDRKKIDQLCENKKLSVLNDITRSISNNQLDHIIIDKELSDKSYVTSYHNFISDHKSITARIGMEGNSLTDEIKMKITFDNESHLKKKQNEESEDKCSRSSYDSDSLDSSQESNPEMRVGNMYHNFRRKFLNPDYATCWLNSCLQLILSGFDHFDFTSQFESELGLELIRLRDSNEESSLNPTAVNTIIVAAEDTRIALRISELEAEIQDETELEHRIGVVRRLRYDLLHGQQCIRDFFLCIQENAESWLDVCFPFYFTIKHSTICCGCHQVIESETDQMYVEMDVPINNAILSEYLEDNFCTSTLNARFCKNECHTICQAEKRFEIKIVEETEFFIIILSRTKETLDGFELNENLTISTNDVYIR